MDIHQILNNNVITTLDAEGQEFIAMGKGLAFSKKLGDKIDTRDIEKFFVPENYQEVVRARNADNGFPVEYVPIADAILEEARAVLGEDLNGNLPSTLAAHIYRVVEQFEEGLYQTNILNSEIKRFYPQGYAIGLYALDYIEKELKVKLPEDEAGLIALHLFAGQMNGKFHITQKMIVLIKEIFTIIGNTFDILEDEESLDRFNFMTQLKYLSYKVLNGVVYEANEDDVLFSITSKENPIIHQCVVEIREHLLQEYNYKLNTEDEFYLMVHISKLITAN